MFHLFRTYVVTNALCCERWMSRREKWAQMEVVPLDATVPSCAWEAKRTRRPPHACAGACIPQQQAGPGRQALVAIALCGETSCSAQTSAVATCQRASRSCMHELWGPPKAKWEAKARCTRPFLGCMHLGKYVACAVSCRISCCMQRECVRRVAGQ
jgi:hypothetical protein